MCLAGGQDGNFKISRTAGRLLFCSKASLHQQTAWLFLITFKHFIQNPL
jgi:hypothetical protein